MKKTKNRAKLSIVTGLLIGMLFSITGCDKNKPVLKEAEMDGIDISGTTKNYEKPDTGFYRSYIAQRIEKNVDLTIAVAPIGTPSDKPPIIEHFDAVPAIDEDEAPSIRDAQKRVADSVRTLNTLKINRFLVRIQKEIFETKQALQLKTLKPSEDLTDLTGFLKKAQVFLAEPTFKDSNFVRRLIILSDCMQDLGPDKVADTVKHGLKSIPSLQLFLVGGCKNKKIFDGIPYHEFNSFKEVIIFLTTKPN